MRTKRGFTLIELLVVIAIIAIVAAVLYPVFDQAREKSREAKMTLLERVEKQERTLATMSPAEARQEAWNFSFYTWRVVEVVRDKSLFLKLQATAQPKLGLALRIEEYHPDYQLLNERAKEGYLLVYDVGRTTPPHPGCTSASRLMRFKDASKE